MKVIEKLMEITGETEEECSDLCPYNFKEIPHDSFESWCDDCHMCLGQEMKEDEK